MVNQGLIICHWYSAESHHTQATLAPTHTPCLFSIHLHTVRQHLVNTHFLLLHLLSGTLFKMMSRVPHHCHNISLIWRHTCFIQSTKTGLYPWSLYICAQSPSVALLCAGLLRRGMVYKQERVLRVCDGSFCSKSATYDGAVQPIVVAQTIYFVSASYIDRKPKKWWCVVTLDDFGRRKITRVA